MPGGSRRGDALTRDHRSTIGPTDRDRAAPRRAGACEAHTATQALAAPHADAAVAAVDPSAATVDDRAQCRSSSACCRKTRCSKGRRRGRAAGRRVRSRRHGARIRPRRRERSAAEDEAPPQSSAVDATDFGDYGGGEGDWGGGSSSDDDEFFPQQVASPTLRDHLNAQLALLNLPLRDRQLTAALIDALDEDGYLSSSLEELAEYLPDELEIDADELQIALNHVQNLEPAGRRRARLRRVPRAAAARAAAPTRRTSRWRSRSSSSTSTCSPPRLHQAEAPAAHRRRRCATCAL